MTAMTSSHQPMICAIRSRKRAKALLRQEGLLLLFAQRMEVLGVTPPTPAAAYPAPGSAARHAMFLEMEKRYGIEPAIHPADLDLLWHPGMTPARS